MVQSKQKKIEKSVFGHIFFHANFSHIDTQHLTMQFSTVILAMCYISIYALLAYPYLFSISVQLMASDTLYTSILILLIVTRFTTLLNG